MSRAARRNWPEYLMEAGELGALMFAVCCFSTLYEHPASPVRQALPDPLARRALMACTVATLLLLIIYSPWGARSGAHFNPSVTLTYLRLGKIAPADAAWYILAQCIGGLAGVALAAALLGPALADPAVGYAATLPGRAGAGVAFVVELLIAFTFMTMVLNVTNTPRLAPYTGFFVAALVASFIVTIGPFSGPSLNPARSLASAVPAMRLDTLWIYAVAPPLGMLLAAETYLRVSATRLVGCAKLYHRHGVRCIFHCAYQSDQ